MVLKKTRLGGCLLSTCWEADLPSIPLSCHCSLLIFRLYMKVWKVSQLVQCVFHTEDRKLRFFLLLFIYFLSWKKLQLWISSWVVFIARGGAHWAELRQRYHCGLKERQGINAAIWSPSRLWGCIIKMTRMRPHGHQPAACRTCMMFGQVASVINFHRTAAASTVTLWRSRRAAPQKDFCWVRDFAESQSLQHHCSIQSKLHCTTQQSLHNLKCALCLLSYPYNTLYNKCLQSFPSACIKLLNNDIQIAFMKNIDVSFAIRKSVRLDEIVTVWLGVLIPVCVRYTAYAQHGTLC